MKRVVLVHTAACFMVSLSRARRESEQLLHKLRHEIDTAINTSVRCITGLEKPVHPVHTWAAMPSHHEAATAVGLLLHCAEHGRQGAQALLI